MLSLARYDLNFDVRDRARMIGSLLLGVVNNLLEDDEEREDQGGVVLRREQVKLVLFDGKLGPPPDSHTSRECIQAHVISLKPNYHPRRE